MPPAPAHPSVSSASPVGEALLTERIAIALMDEITGGGYAAGERLPPEQVIAERLGVSRTVLREAIARLKVDGIVTSKPGRGMSVVSNTRPSVLRIHAAADGDGEHMLAILELRRGFEFEAAALAAARRGDDDLAAMRGALDGMARALRTGDVAAGVDADLAFHRAIAQATGNPHYPHFFDFVAGLVRRSLEVARTASSRVRGRGNLSQAEHERLFAAIEAGDPEQARQQARSHVENTEARLRACPKTGRSAA